ncbi:MAG TPA: phospholipase D-like domain-containing protein [Polyangiaceae bacterium]
MHLLAPHWFLTHHVVSIASNLLVLVLVASLLRQRRRPVGNAIAWLLAIILIPYVGIPLYLSFGGRKLKQRVQKKRPLDPQGGSTALEARARSTLQSVLWLDDGVLAYQTFLEQIRGAQHSIRIVTFVIVDDDTGRPLVDALIERARAGLEVRLLIDDLLRFHAPHAKLRELVAAGARVERFMPLVHLPFLGHNNLRNHRKIALFDGRDAIVGGMNFGQEYMGRAPAPERWRDLSLLIRGEAVSELDTVFRADWEFASGEILSAPAQLEPGGVPVRVVPSGPDSASDPIYDADLTAIFRAERRIWIATPYFVPDDALLRALVIAVRRGVDVRVLTPAHSNHLLSDLASASCLRDLSAAGVTIHLFDKMLHAKTLLVDDSLCVVGSANFDMRSLFLNYEIALFFSGSAEVQRLSAWFEATFALCSIGPRPAGGLRSVLDDVARLVAPLL